MADNLHIVIVLGILLIVLLGLRQVRDTVNPVFAGIVKGLATHAQQNATAYGIAILFGLSASLSAFYDIFSQTTKTDLDIMSWHQYLALWCKILNPFIVASLAYATKRKEPDIEKPSA